MDSYETFVSMPVEDQRLFAYGLIFFTGIWCLLFAIDLISSFIKRFRLKKRYKKIGTLSISDCTLYFECLLSEMKYDKFPYDYRASAINTVLELLKDKAYREHLALSVSEIKKGE